MTWNHPALAERALDEGDREIAALRADNEHLRSILKGCAAQISKLAFDMRPPNTYTPQFVMIAQEMERRAYLGSAVDTGPR